MRTNGRSSFDWASLALGGVLMLTLQRCSPDDRELGVTPVDAGPVAVGAGGSLVEGGGETAADPTPSDTEQGPTPATRVPPQGSDASSDIDSAGGGSCIEGSTEPCGPEREEGICRFGARSCSDGVWGECEGAVLPAARDCSSEQDNDCDGQPDNTLDDTCRCPLGGTRACDEHPDLDGKGPCIAGRQTCVAGPENATTDWGRAKVLSGPAQATRAKSRVTTRTATARPTAAATASRARPCPADRAATTASASGAPAPAPTTPLARARAPYSHPDATARLRSTTTATACLTTPSMRPARARSVRPGRAGRTPGETAMAPAAPALRRASPVRRTRAVASALAPAPSAPHRATPAPSLVTMQTAMERPTAAANVSPDAETNPARETPTTPAATPKVSAYPARLTRIARSSVAAEACASPACAARRAAGMGSCKPGSARLAMMGTPPAETVARRVVWPGARLAAAPPSPRVISAASSSAAGW